MAAAAAVQQFGAIKFVSFIKWNLFYWKHNNHPNNFPLVGGGLPKKRTIYKRSRLLNFNWTTRRSSTDLTHRPTDCGHCAFRISEAGCHQVAVVVHFMSAPVRTMANFYYYHRVTQPSDNLSCCRFSPSYRNELLAAWS